MLTDISGGETYRSVDIIKVVLKQLKGFLGFKKEHAGALTKSAVTAVKIICDEAAGTSSLLTERKDKIIGSVYIRTNPNTSQKYQVVRKLTNAMTEARIYRKVLRYFGVVAYALSSIYHLISSFPTAAASTSSPAGFIVIVATGICINNIALFDYLCK